MEDSIDRFVQAEASDGFILVPHITPGGLGPFVDQVVRFCRSEESSGPTTKVRLCGIISVSDPPRRGGR